MKEMDSMSKRKETTQDIPHKIPNTPLQIALTTLFDLQAKKLRGLCRPGDLKEIDKLIKSAAEQACHVKVTPEDLPPGFRK